MFPRTILPDRASGLRAKGSLQAETQFGKIQLRGTTARGFEWDETFSMLRSGDPDVEELMTFIMNAWNRGQTFDIKLTRTPGSLISPNGTGTSGVTVSGGSQTGSTLATTGWPLSTSNVVMPGDVIKVQGIAHIFKITAAANSDGSGNATLDINPSIFSGNSPVSGASVTTTDVTLTGYIKTLQVPDVVDGFHYDRLSITVGEAF